MPWLGLTLELDPAAAERVSEALLEAGAQSVWLERPDAPRVGVHALVSPHGDPAALVAAAAAAVGLPPPPFSVATVEDEDWVRKTQAQFAPLESGRLWIGPSWHEAPPGRVVVRLDPGLAFGTGSHPSTRLCVAYLERTVQGGERVLDYGCGSGILAIAALKLGAASVDAVDVDPQAVATTAANARANGVAVRAALPEAMPPQSYEIVVSNILAQPLILLAPVLAARTAPGGALALAGILDTQAADVIAAYSPTFEMRVDALEEGWALLAGRRR